MKEFPAKLLVWSAADEEGLSRLSSLYSQHFKERRHIVNEKLIDDLAFTLNTRRNSLAWKSFVVVKSFNDLLSLDQVVSKPIHAAVKSPRVGFVFTGQGAQWYGMGRKLSYIRRST
jgi:acyl transferase domain-containing protein